MKHVVQYPLDPAVRAIQESWDAVLPVEAPETSPRRVWDYAIVLPLVLLIGWAVLKLVGAL